MMNKLLQLLVSTGDVSHKVLPTYQMRGEVRSISRGDIQGAPMPVIKMTAEEAKRLQMQKMAQQAIANQATLKPGSKLTDRDALLEKNRQYAASTGKRFNPNTGGVSPLLSDNTDRTMRRVQENIVNPMLQLEGLMTGAGLVGKGAGSIMQRIAPAIENIGFNTSRNIRKAFPGFVDKRMRAIDKGNKWSQEWYSNPTIQQRYNDWIEESSLLKPEAALYQSRIMDIAPTVIRGINLDKSYANRLSGTIARDNYEKLLKEGAITKGTTDRFGFGKNDVVGRYSHGSNDALIDVLHPALGRKFNTANTTVHENIHAITRGNDGLTQNAKSFLKAPFNRSTGNKYDKYLTNPTEVHARIGELRRQFGLTPETKVDISTMNRIMELGKQGKTSVDKRWFELVNDKSKLRWLFNNAPTVTVPIAGAALLDQKRKGGVIIDSRGQWAYPGKQTIVPTPTGQITMQGVPYPVYGQDETGYGQMMYPDGEYEFPGEMVYETPMMSKGGQHGGLDRWFAEKWVDVKTGKACGRQEGEKRKGYPACRPSRRVSEDTPKTASELSSSEREKFKRSKTSSERINYQHRRKEYGGEQTETDMTNKPNNPSLWSRAKSLAKQKFNVYPSAYANGWAAKWYKSKGGTWRKAEYGMEVPMMAEGGKPEWLMEAQLKAQGYSGDALRQKMASMANGGEPQNAGFQALPEAVQEKIMNSMAYGGYMGEMAYGGSAQQAAIAIAMKKAGKKPKSMADGGEPNGEMALGQMAAVQDKMNKLLKFVRPEDNLDPWIASKLAVMDHSADAIADYMMYGPDAEEMEEQEMKGGGYVVTRSNDRKGKTHKVTGPDGTVKYFGDSKLGQHPRDPERKAAFYARHKKNLEGNPYFRAFARATWENGGQIDEMANGGYIGYDGKRHMSSTPTWSGNMGYQTGGEPLWHANWNDAEQSYESIDPIAEQFNQDVAAMPARAVSMNVPASAPVAKAVARPRSKGSSYSVVDYMNSLDMPSDYATRKALAEEYGIKGYRGTADQNMMLISAISQAVKSQGSKAAAVSTQSGSADYAMNSSNMLRRGYTASSNPFMFGEIPQRPAVKTSGAAKAAAAKKVNAANAQDAEDARSFAKYKTEDPYFFAEESDPSWVKAIDMPFTYLRDLGAQVVLDQDLMALGQLLALGAGTRFIKGKSKIEPYYGGQKALPRMPGKSLPAPAAPGPRGPIPGPASGGYIKPGVPGTSPRGFEIPSAGLRSPGYPRFAQGGPVVGDEMEVTPEQLEQLRAQGYQFEII